MPSVRHFERHFLVTVSSLCARSAASNVFGLRHPNVLYRIINLAVWKLDPGVRDLQLILLVTP